MDHPLRREPVESVADRLIREATERGEFDNLPGAGKPLNLGRRDKPWVQRWVEREQIPLPLPTSLALRKESQQLTEHVLTLRTEQAVRDYLEDFNSRVLEARRIPVDGPPVVVRTVDVDEMVETWRERR
jgi:Domain of unknown function (DUF1992)